MSNIGITTLGLTNTANTNYLTTSGTGTYSTTITPDFNFSISSNYMENSTSQPQQVKVAVFEIEHNDKLVVTSTKFVDEFWIEQKPKADLKMAVAKKLISKDVDLDRIIIKEIQRVSF